MHSCKVTSSCFITKRVNYHKKSREEQGQQQQNGEREGVWGGSINRWRGGGEHQQEGGGGNQRGEGGEREKKRVIKMHIRVLTKAKITLKVLFQSVFIYFLFN